MAKKAFNLGDYLQQAEAKMDTMPRMTAVELHLIDPSPGNFYSMPGLEALADNIATVGLLEPMLVREKNGRYVVVSGHRRRAALRILMERGEMDPHDKIPVFLDAEPDPGDAQDKDAARAALRQLRLIYANSDNRQYSSADKTREVHELTVIFSELKRLGYEFPGKIREHVAAAAHISESRAARLTVIGKNLTTPKLREAYEAGRLGENAAYEIARRGADVIGRVENLPISMVCEMTLDRLGVVLEGLEKKAAEDATETAGEIIDQIKKREAEPVSKMDTPADESPVSCNADEYLAERAREDGQYFSMLQYHAARLIRDLAAESPEWQLGRQRQDGIEALKKQHRHHGTGGMKVDLQGSPKGLELYFAKKGLRIQRTWTDVYDMLCITALQLAAQAGREKDGEKDPSTRPAASVGMTGVAWQDGTPQRNGRYYCRIRFADSPEDGGRVHEQRGEWRDGGWWFFGAPEKYGIQVVGWWPLPDEEMWK